LGPEEAALARLALDLGAIDGGGPLSIAEKSLIARADSAASAPTEDAGAIRAAILAGEDPLGALLARIRPPEERRQRGAFYTPASIVGPMVEWVLSRAPDRLIDPGCGSGRFTIAALRRRPELPVIAVDCDPLATLLTRAALAIHGLAATVVQADYTALELPAIAGRTAFVGNPPYVRHHDLSADAKMWARRAGERLALKVSTLAGLHVHFYLATALHARPGDVGCFVTSAEWLDVNYGAAVRRLVLGPLGGQSLLLIDPRAVPFDDAMTTAAIIGFVAGSELPSLRLRFVGEPSQLGDLDRGVEVSRERLAAANRWTSLVPDSWNDPGDEDGPVSDGLPLREIAAVHRGAVTGANGYFLLTREQAEQLGLTEWCRPAISTAEEILRSGGVVRDGPERRLLLDVPPDVDRAAHPRLDAYLRLGEQSRDGKPPIGDRYIPTHRRPWWYLGRVPTPPIVASYMARQPPVFALNPDGLAIINIAHGIFPRSELTRDQLEALVAALNRRRGSFRGNGRTYHGGLEKFEPREMEALPLGDLLISDGAAP
jgi:SAM-dependent methyltransferase